MGLSFACGTLNIGTGAVSTTYSVTGKSPTDGTWKAAYFFWSGRAETTDAGTETDIRPGFGVAVSSSSRWVVSGQSDHTATTTATDSYHSDQACVAVQDIAGAVVGLADFSAFTADGFTLIVDDQFPAALEVSYVLFGGTDITNAAAGNFVLNTATGNADYSTTSFPPDFLLLGSMNHTLSSPSVRTNLALMIGAATAADQAVLALKDFNAQATTYCLSYCRTGEIYAEAELDTDALDRTSFVQFNSDGWRLNRLENDSGALRVFFLALKGGSYKIGNFLSATNTTAYTTAHGMAVAPKGALFFSANRVASTVNIPTAEVEWSVGASNGTLNFCHYVRSKHNVADTDSFTAVSHDQCYYNASTATTQAMEGEGHVNSFDSTNINFQMTDADPAQSFIWYAAFGDAPAGAVTTLTAAKGSLALTSKTSLFTRVQAASKGSLTLTSKAMAPTRVITGSKGALALTGKTSVFTKAQLADKGNLVLVGKAATFRSALSAAKNSLGLTGATATFRAVLNAAKGTLTLTGNGVAFIIATRLAADKGALTLAGKAISFRETFLAAKGALSLTGGAANFQIAFVLPAAKGALTLTGKQVSFLESLSAVKGTLVLSGRDAAFAERLLASKGTLTLIPKDAAFTILVPITTTLIANKGILLLTGKNATFGGILPIGGHSGARRIYNGDEEEDEEDRWYRRFRQ